MCNLKFYPKSDDLAISSSRVEEEDEVARRQHEEDLRLYGSRIEPMDAVEMDAVRELPNTPKKDSTTDYEATLDVVEDASKTGSKSDNDEASIHINGNAETNPLSAWLTQSALPSVMPIGNHPLDLSAGTTVDLAKEELNEIEKFRNVHLASNPEIDHATQITKVEEASDLKLPSQIYYRNIVDRYPLLPTYLARRLAEANSGRAERLSRQRVEAMAKAKIQTAVSAASGQHEAPRRVERPGKDLVYNLSRHDDEAQEFSVEPPPSLAPSELQVKKKKAYNEGNITSPAYVVPIREYKPAQPKKNRANSYASLSNSEPQSDYWNGGSSSQRTKSIGSCSSSRNSSLHGSPEFCYQKQYQNMNDFAFQPKHQNSSPSLPPPPVKIGNEQSSKLNGKKYLFDCDICGESVKVDRRRQWQYVVEYKRHWSFADNSY